MTTTETLTLAAWRALPARPDFRRTATTYRDGWNGSTSTRTATYAGACVLCGTRTYTDSGGNDPRGPLGDHAAAPLDPAEYGAVGAVVPACFLCQNDTEERYARTLRRAERVGRWIYPEPIAPVCGRCDARVALVMAPDNQYRGWFHLTAAPDASELSQWAREYRAAEHEARPRETAHPDCRGRVHHFSGSWCAVCGGWG
jgi:hypothetical protein